MANADFPLITPWADIKVTANCTAWGNWYATLVAPNPWNKLQSLEGGYTTTLALIDASFPPGLMVELGQHVDTHAA